MRLILTYLEPATLRMLENMLHTLSLTIHYPVQYLW